MAATRAPHVPVMAEQVIQHLRLRAGGRYIDCTLGGGGYSRRILATQPNIALLVGLDRDASAIQSARACPELSGNSAFHAVHSRFGRMAAALREHKLTDIKFDGIVFDLGLSSVQLDDSQRGFSFRKDGPLDMRMTQDANTSTAADIVNSAPPHYLSRILTQYGEERFANAIANRIVQRRTEEGPFSTTHELANVVRAAIPASARYGQRIDPATRTFQALRIAVNEELKELLSGLQDAEELLAANGRLVVLSYHSLEDRIVKDFMLRCSGRRRQNELSSASTPSLKLITHSVETPLADEIADNPRARSAKLRAAMRTAAPPLSRAVYQSIEEEQL